MQNTALIIAAAGQGSRMGAHMNKQFIELKGKAILAHTLERFRGLKDIGQVILLHHPDERESMEALIASLQLPFEITYVIGGDNRQQSVYNGLKAIRETLTKVVIHDGARLFVTKEMLSHMEAFLSQLESESGVDGAFFGVPLKDTIKQETDTGFVTIDRSTLHAVQTPQLFNKERLIKAHENAISVGFLGTDDCSLIEREGGHIKVLPGNYWNIKVTTPEDLLIAETFLKLF